MKVTTIIFDLGRVLLDFDHRIAAARIGGLTHKSPEEVYDLFFDSKLTRWFEEGRIEPEAFYGKIKARLRLKMKYEQFVPIWNEIFFQTDCNRQVAAIARQLSGKYTVCVLSNINILHLEYIKEKFPIFGSFRHVFASCELGCVKPAPCIYIKTLKALGAKPAEVFYTDDRPELIEKARTMGMRAYVFTGVEQLRSDLARCGIETDTSVLSLP
ncbi:MAG: HAD family hydrolase [Deltaproteobacteria bacterium]